MPLNNHQFFRWPTSLFWLLPATAAVLLYWRLGEIGNLWWYLTIPPLCALALIDLFTMVWFGVFILCTLFVYCSVGSSGVPTSIAIFEPETWKNVRETLEMTEFEWFHWWPFKWLVATLCLTMSIVTVRRIPFNMLNLGVWAIHSGVIVMVTGCVVYFGLKIEGDVIISRNRVVIEIPGEEEVSMVAAPSNAVRIGKWLCTITNLNPNWELMSGNDIGKKVYAVTVSVQGPDTSFARQLISGYPEYTEDIVATGDSSRPMARAKKVLGRALVDDSIVMYLTQDVKDRFFVTQSAAVYLRKISNTEDPAGEWFERPIHTLPRFNDYIPTQHDVWIHGGVVQPSPLEISLTPTNEDDSLQQDVVVTGYLRYAFSQSRIVVGDELFPVAWVSLRSGEASVQSVEMYAFDNSLNTADSSLISFRWLENDAELDVMKNSLTPSIRCIVHGVDYSFPITSGEEYVNVGDTDYSFRIKSVQKNLHISGIVASLAIVEIRKGDLLWDRWVFNEPEMNRDVIKGGEHDANKTTFVDEAIKMRYFAGGTPITIIGGLEKGAYGLLLGLADGEPEYRSLSIGDETNLTDEVTLTIDRIEERTMSETRPSVVPPSQRDLAANNLYSMIKLVIPTPEGTTSAWIPFHQYPFKSKTDLVHRFRYEPTLMQLPNGTLYQVLFSRKSAPLPAPIALDSFEIDSHVGGFTGKTSSVLNWRSLVRFLGEEEVASSVSVNDPQQYGNYWFFQSQWDPPDNTSAGLNYTVLGVGNRFGVLQMLLGCCITVVGMIWAFYIKPFIKRKRQRAIFERHSV